MNKDDLKRLADQRRFIPGIYNYCDRWCERCPFTSRCMNFAMTDEQFDDPADRDLMNETFWHKLTELLQNTRELLEETAGQLGIDLDALDVEEVAEEERIREKVVRNHACCRSAKSYSEMVENWFDSFEKTESADFDFREASNSAVVDEIETSTDLADAFEVIRWYQHLIYVKLMRAVHGMLDDTLEDLDEFPNDSDGSAKVALISLDRSMAAWGQVRNHFLLREEAILAILVHLDRLRRRVETLFPNARSFIRPGFDEVELNS